MGILSHVQRRAVVEEESPSRLFLEVNPAAVLTRAKEIIERSDDYHPCDLVAAVWAASRDDALAFRRAFAYLRAFQAPVGEVEEGFSRRVITHGTKLLAVKFLADAAGWASLVEAGFQDPPPLDTATA